MKIFLDSVGCRLNQAEIERYASQFHAAGHTLVSDPADADWVVINTCTVTSAAAADSRKKTRQAARFGAGKVILTGCWSTLQPEKAARLPGVEQVIPNEEKDDLALRLIGQDEASYDREPVEREPVPGTRLRTRAFIKAQDGCDNRCTFCVTTLARGSSRSRSIEGVVADVQAAIRTQEGNKEHRGALEVVLTGVHLGSWGQDLNPKLGLADLVRAILLDTDVPRLRLSSLEPWDLQPSFFQLWRNPRLCRQLHLPLQSGSAATLRRMARKTSPGEFRALVLEARAAIPGVAITTDVIAGFPGESDEEFAESLAFVEEMQFAGGHIFTYSARPGTTAARMPDQVPNVVRKERSARLRGVVEQSARLYREEFRGQVLSVLWESAVGLDGGGWKMSGLTDNYIRVQARGPRRMWNQISHVRLLEPDGDGYQGEILRMPDAPLHYFTMA